jgi:hypothetical protein
MGREPIKVANLRRDRREIEKVLRSYPRDRRPRMNNHPQTSEVEIVDDWEVVPDEVWALWHLKYGPGHRLL